MAKRKSSDTDPEKVYRNFAEWPGGPAFLTDDFIKSLPLARTPAARERFGDSVAYVISDTGQPGLRIKVGQTAKVWQFVGRLHGAKTNHKLGDYGAAFIDKDKTTGAEAKFDWNVKHARRKAYYYLTYLEAGEDKLAAKKVEVAKIVAANAETLLWLLTRQVRGWQTEKADTLAELQASIAANKDTLGKHKVIDLRAIIRHLKDWLDLPLRSIGWPMVAKRFAEVGATPGKRTGEPMTTTANRLFRNLRVMLNGWISLHPAERLENPVDVLRKSDKRANVTWYDARPRSGWISTKGDGAEFVAWWRAVATEEPTIRDYIVLTALQGAREGETAKLEWSDLDFADEGAVTYRKTKNGEDYTFPMTPYVQIGRAHV